MNSDDFERNSIDGALRLLVGRLRRSLATRSGRVGAPTDAQLLEAFVDRGEEGAFEMLVWRHGAMVYNVCRRILKDVHEAEDAFQATFLVLFRKASAIHRHDAVSGWLYKVAYRVACTAKSVSRQAACQQHDMESLKGKDSAEGDVDWRDLGPRIDQEISRLPEKLRVPVVLCYLQGSSIEEAASVVGCPVGTIGSRLARGKDRLRLRLARRGVTLSVAALAASLSQNASSAGMPTVLVRTVLDVAGQLTSTSSYPAYLLAERVLRNMAAAKLAGTVACWLGWAVLAVGVASAALWASGWNSESPKRELAARIVVPIPPIQKEQKEAASSPENKTVRPKDELNAPDQSARVFDLPGITAVHTQGWKGSVSTRKADKYRLIFKSDPKECLWKVEAGVLHLTGYAEITVEAPGKVVIRSR